MIFNKKTAVAGIFALLVTLTGASAASAQTAVPILAPAPTVCVALTVNLGYGSHDYYTGGAVTQLQQFLATQGYFNSAYLGTGVFGPITVRAVQQYQRAHGLPPVGVVGPLTRAAIKNQTCGGVVVPPINQAPGISGLSPASGPIGTQVTISGYNFTGSNTILMDGMVVAMGVPAQSTGIVCFAYPCGGSQSITFTIPSYLAPNCPTGMFCAQYVRELTTGNYTVTVQNANGTSNGQVFTVTGGSTTGGTLSINGLDAPPTLSMTVPGTWTVRATAPAETGTLHYSVVWGDEGYYGMSPSIMAPTQTSTQTSASFTHAYQYAGTFKPVFTVTDDFGHTASVSSTVVVTPIY